MLVIFHSVTFLTAPFTVMIKRQKNYRIFKRNFKNCKQSWCGKNSSVIKTSRVYREQFKAFIFFSCLNFLLSLIDIISSIFNKSLADLKKRKVQSLIMFISWTKLAGGRQHTATSGQRESITVHIIGAAEPAESGQIGAESAAAKQGGRTSFVPHQVWLQPSMGLKCVFCLQMERRFHSQLQNLRERLDQSDSTNRSLQNYVQFLRNSYKNVYGDCLLSTTDPFPEQ